MHPYHCYSEILLLLKIDMVLFPDKHECDVPVCPTIFVKARPKNGFQRS